MTRVRFERERETETETETEREREDVRGLIERESTSGGEERERKRERERNERANGESRTRGCEALENTESVLDCSQRSLFFLCGASRREEANSCTLRHTARNHRKKGKVYEKVWKERLLFFLRAVVSALPFSIYAFICVRLLGRRSSEGHESGFLTKRS